MFTTRLGESAKCIASVSVSHFPSLSYTDFTLAGIECVLGGGRATPIMCTYMKFYLVCLAYKHASAVRGELPGLFSHLLLLSPLRLLLPASRITLSLKRFL